MKEFLFDTYDISSDSKNTYRIKAENLAIAKDTFKRHCIPLFCNDFDWDSMVRLFFDSDITIDIIEIDDIIDL